ncbi:MAG: hypothetical protein AB8B71_04605 [Paracoccaceae bacterium]
MPNTQFEARIERIRAREASLQGPELMAGVGDVGHCAQPAEQVVRPKPKASLILGLLGAVIGALAFEYLLLNLDLDAVLAMDLSDLVALALTTRGVGLSASILLICLCLSFYSVLRGPKSWRIMSLSCSAMGGAMGVGLTALFG